MELIENKQLGFRFEFTKIKDDIWVKGNDIAEQLGYERPRDAIRDHVPEDCKVAIKNFNSGKSALLKNEHPNTMIINLTGALHLLGMAKTKKGAEFRRWCYGDVVPSIMRTGKYELKPVTIRSDHRLSINTEFDLQAKVIEFLRANQEKYHLKIVVPLGELQDTPDKRIKSRMLGYEPGQPDIIVNNPSKHHCGLIIELKNPAGSGELSPMQKAVIARYREDGYRVIVSNDGFAICAKLGVWFEHLRLQCRFCKLKFRTQRTREIHYKVIHSNKNPSDE